MKLQANRRFTFRLSQIKELSAIYVNKTGKSVISGLTLTLIFAKE